jgi:hypothetical protein
MLHLGVGPWRPGACATALIPSLTGTIDQSEELFMVCRSACGRVGMTRVVRQALAGLLAVAGVVAVPEPAQAVPPRRLARRGVIVVVPPAAAAGAPAASPIASVPAPIVVGPGPRPWRRLLAAPPAPDPAVARQLPAAAAAIASALAAQAGGSSAPAVAPTSSAAPQPAVPKPAGAAAASATPTPSRPAPAIAATKQQPPIAVAEEIPVPQPVAAPETAAAAAAHPEHVAFTPGWYAAHPQAWRPAEQPIDWWQVPETATIVDWLGEQVRPAAGTAADATAVTAAGGESVGADGLRSVLVLPAGHANQAAPAAAAGEWLPLGVFAVVPRGVAAEQATQYQQLLVDRSGVIRGNLYDDVSGTVQPIEGTIDRTALTASWAVKGSGSKFTLPVGALATPPRLASVTAGGRPRDVELVPVSRP